MVCEFVELILNKLRCIEQILINLNTSTLPIMFTRSTNMSVIGNNAQRCKNTLCYKNLWRSSQVLLHKYAWEHLKADAHQRVSNWPGTTVVLILLCFFYFLFLLLLGTKVQIYFHCYKLATLNIFDYKKMWLLYLNMLLATK